MTAPPPPQPEPLTPEQITTLEMFRRLELALYGKAVNTWEKGRGERVFALLCEWRDSHESLRAEIQQLRGLVKGATAASLSSALCRGCGSPTSPTLIDGRYDKGYFILDERGINYPWHRACAAKALAQVATLTEQVESLRRERDQLAAQVERMEKRIRLALWLNHGHGYPYLYGDDGEMQCHHKDCLGMDYHRDSMDIIDIRLHQQRQRYLAAAARALGALNSKTEEPR